MIKLMDVTPEISRALAILRTFTGSGGGKLLPGQVVQAINTLDDAGVFAEIDERNEYASAEEILEESAVTASLFPGNAPLDPAEWGDTTSADMARHQGLGSGLHRRIPLDEPLTGEEARRMRDALKGTRCTCGRPEIASPSLHSGNCPVWMKHHNLI